MIVGFIGLGTMGYPMAGHISSDYRTLVWNRTAQVSLNHAEQYGTQAVAELSELAPCDVICSCLPVSVDVHGVVEAIARNLKPSGYWIDFTSGDPAECRQTADLLQKHGWSYLDAPVSGGLAGAQKGGLTVMAGAESDALEAVRGVIECVAAKIVRVGGVGAGHAVKAANNALLAMHLLAASEVLLMLRKNGVDPAVALEAINAGTGRSAVTQHYIPEKVLNRSFPLTFKLGLLDKDVRIAAASCSQAGLAAPMISLTSQLFAAAKMVVGADVDYTEVVKLLESWTDVTV
ncbi:MAG: NAD(P)-dependent oxidoreductase [Armatimonadota bacterium]